LKGQETQKADYFFDFLPFKIGLMLSRNVGKNFNYTPCNAPEECRSQLKLSEMSHTLLRRDFAAKILILRSCSKLTVRGRTYLKKNKFLRISALGTLQRVVWLWQKQIHS
jgi:hypothetical protein